jgi:hypothetical protein
MVNVIWQFQQLLFPHLKDKQTLNCYILILFSRSSPADHDNYLPVLLQFLYHNTFFVKVLMKLSSDL